jgi:hypothetical protein
MKVKNSILYLAFALSLLFISQESIAADAILQANFYVNPSISSPGSDGYIQVVLKNIGPTNINSIRITVTSVETGIIVDPYNAVNIGGLGVGDSSSAIFKFSVPRTTPPNLYRINFKISYCQDSGCREINQFTIVNVQSQPLLELKSIKPSTLSIGGKTNLVFTFEVGNSELTNVIITWEEPNSLILPLGESNRIVLSSVSANQEIDVPVTVAVSPTINPGIYPIYVRTKYLAKGGTEQNSTFVVGLIVGGTTEFTIDMQEFTGNSITLSIANIGVNPATAVSISLPEQENFRIVGAQNIFLGNLNPGDSTVASFTIIPRNTNTSSELRTKISYTDTSGLRQSSEYIVFVPAVVAQVYQTPFRQRQQGNFWYYFIVGIAVAAVVFYLLIRRKRKH